MAPFYSEKPRLSEADQQTLLAVAREAIASILTGGKPLMPDPADYSPPLREVRATFVTLHREERLRGCVGVIEAIRPLVADVAANAIAAAFRDYRFPPVQKEEVATLAISISILSPREPIPFTSQRELIGKLRPGIDGLVLQDKGMQGTFLPAVWEQCPDPQQFLLHLKLKAGLPADHWSDTIRVDRFTVESIA